MQLYDHIPILMVYPKIFEFSGINLPQKEIFFAIYMFKTSDVLGL